MGPLIGDQLIHLFGEVTNRAPISYCYLKQVDHQNYVLVLRRVWILNDTDFLQIFALIMYNSIGFLKRSSEK
jgi:hypothetical protein